MNDTADHWQGELRFGVFLLAGAYVQDETRPVTLLAATSTPLAQIDAAVWANVGHAHAGAFARLLEADGHIVCQHRLFLNRFRDTGPGASSSDHVACRRQHHVARWHVFIWNVCVDVDGDADVPDNAFDLLPRIPYILPWPATASIPLPPALAVSWCWVAESWPIN